MTAQNYTGDRLGPYRLLERLGEGGMGVVYLAADPDHRKVAVKALRPAVAADPNARRRLAREVETMRRVRSPYVAEVIDADVACDPPYIVTRYVSGRTLEDMVGASGPLTGQALARVASGLAQAMAAVHAAGVVHRDLKPGNVMIARGEPVVIDFGIAQVPDSTRLTQTGMFMGTPGYLAPEVIEGQQSGPASDVHSWGATVAFAATGRPPFGTGGFETIFYRIVNGQPDLNGFPAPLLSLVAQALSRDPARRPSAADLCQRTAVLDASSLVPTVTAVAGGALPFGAPGTVADMPTPTALPGAGAGAVPAVGPVAPAAWPPSTQPLAAGYEGAGNRPAALAGNGAGGFGPATRRAGGQPIQDYRDYRDMLPPVQYGPGEPATPRSAQAGNGVAARGASRSPAGGLLVLATIAAAIAIAIAFPLAGTVGAVIGLMALRAADSTAGSVSRRRSRKGVQAGDAVVAALVFPLALAWSAIRSLLLAPAALVAAAVVAAITIFANPPDVIPLALAYGAGALVAFYGLGPGSGGARRPLRRFYDTAAGTPSTATVSVIVVAAVVCATAVVAAAQAPYFWPFSNTGHWVAHFTLVQNLVHHTRTYLLKLVGK